MRTPTLLSLLIVAITALSSFSPAVARRPLADVAFDTFDDSVMPPPPPPPPHVRSSTAAFGTSTRPSYPSSSATPVAPTNPPTSQLNLTWPYSVASGTADVIRLVDSMYYMVTNTSAGYTEQPVISVDDVQRLYKQQLGEDAWKHQQKLLKKHMKYVNRHYSAHPQQPCTSSANTSCPVSGGGAHSEGDSSDRHHSRGSGGSGGRNVLSKFYLRHAQCRACTQRNEALMYGSTNTHLASYEPSAMLKWCTLAEPKLASELPPAVSGAPLADWEGVCIPAEQQCPSATVDMNVLSPSTCAGDEAVIKQSCSLCVLDGYYWTASHKAFEHGGDNYAGQCHSAPTYTSSESKHAGVVVSTLDGCPSVVASVDYVDAYRSLAASFATFVLFTALLLCCLCVRACCQARKTRTARQLGAARGVTLTSVAVPVVPVVPSVSSSPSPSAPPAAGYPASVAVAHEYSQPLLSSSGLNPPRFAVSTYPQVQAYRV